jgi:hypothetical protein
MAQQLLLVHVPQRSYTLRPPSGETKLEPRRSKQVTYEDAAENVEDFEEVEEEEEEEEEDEDDDEAKEDGFFFFWKG